MLFRDDPFYPALVICIVTAIIAVVMMVGITMHNSTQRANDCVSNGGSYVAVPNTTQMECQK